MSNNITPADTKGWRVAVVTPDPDWRYEIAVTNDDPGDDVEIELVAPDKEPDWDGMHRRLNERLAAQQPDNA